ncbi:Uncharacterized protein AC509_2977 [Pseudomonas amygdali pv. morsprunorum]|nr:Uncharacterized protein AC509_2977 [Pseudomonas amygdali pv. morsprunorum]
MFGNGLDHVNHATDLATVFGEALHGFAQLFHFTGQLADFASSVLHHTATVSGTFAGLFGRQRSVFGVACYFLHGRRHFVHGGGNLVDFVFLQRDAGTGLFADSRQLFGCRGDLRHTVANAADQAAQRNRHVLNGVLQQAQFVLAGGAAVMGQIAVGNPARRNYGAVQRHGNLTRDQERSKDADQQHYQRHTQQLHHSGLLFLLGTDDLQRRQIIGTGSGRYGLLLQIGTDLLGLLQHVRNRRHQHLVLFQRDQRGIHCSICLDRQLAASGVHLRDQGIGGLIGGLTVVGIRNTQVAAKHQTEIGHAVTQVASDLDLPDAGFIRRTQGVVNGLVQQIFKGRADVIGNLDDRFQRLVDFLIDADQLVERLLQTAHLFLDLAQLGQVARYYEHLQALIDTAVQGIQRAGVVLHTRSGRAGRIGLRSNPGIQNVSLDLGDLAAFAHALDQQVGAGVADDGDGQYSEQNSGKAQSELLADFQIVQPFCAHYMCAFDFSEYP